MSAQISAKYLGQYNGQIYFKVATPFSLRTGEVIIYSNQAKTLEVARWRFCPLAGSSLVSGPLPGPGTYVVDVVQYDDICQPGTDMYYLDFYTPSGFIGGATTAEVYLCKNATWGIDCDFGNADMATIVPLGVKIPLGPDVYRVSVNLYAPGFISMRIWHNDQVVYDMGDSVVFPIVVDVNKLPLFPSFVVAPPSTTTIGGIMSTGIRIGAYVFGVAGALVSRNVGELMFSFMVPLVVDKLVGGLFGS
ncbi:MAG: hypothetical protein RXR06_05965 [Thermoproteus sp.]